MNLFTYRNVVTGRGFALLVAVSMILSTLPVFFLIADASPSAPETTLKLFVVPNPPGDDAYMERMTLSNLGSYDIDVTGWRLVENDGTELPLSGILAGPQDVQLCANGNFSENGGVNCNYVFPSGFNLVNSGGSVELQDGDGAVVLEVFWGDVSGEETITPVTAEVSYVVGTVSSETVIVTGDTVDSEGGWWFNRDISNATPIEFNAAQASLGDGSLEVLPLSSDPARKFIGEYYSGQKIAETESFSYDFMIGSGGDSSDSNEFYLNVYANFGESPAGKYYDCRYDVVPSTGSTGSFTTVTFDPTQTYPVTTRGDSPYICPSVPADMDNDSEDSIFRMFSLNMGDTTDGDEGLDGYFDNVVNVTTSGNNVLVTTFDFEPVPSEPERCTIEIVSEADDFVVENGTGAKELSFIHSAWTAVIEGASWIWGDDPVSNPEEDETLTFIKQFGFVGNVVSATLEVASDNSNEVIFNDTSVAVVSDNNNFQFATQDSYDVTGLVEQGSNELAITVNNLGVDGASAQSNPAGLLYKLTIDAEETDVEGCLLPLKEPPAVIEGYKWSDDGDGVWEESENGIEEWLIALRPVSMDPVEELFVSAESADVTTSVTTLTSGRIYTVEVSGTYSFGNRPDFVADAEWSSRNDAYTDVPLAPHGWTLGENTYPSIVGLDLQIDGQNIDWGSFNEGHLYKTIIEGDGSPLDFSIYDSYYADNEGGLEVAVYDVTDYVTYTDAGGYYSFEVSEGEYQIVEEMREGWEQTYPHGPSYYHVDTSELTEEYNFGNMYVAEPSPEASLVITNPDTDGVVLSGIYEFTAKYIDDDETIDHINWAVREGTCNPNTNTVAGNVDGFNDAWSFVGSDFSTTLDMSTWDSGDYCLIVNPSEQSGEDNLRETRWFTLENEVPLECVADVNLLENPSFEDPVLSQPWQNVAPINWNVRATANNALVGMEIQRGVFGWLPSDGNQWTELDTDQNVRIKQTVATIPGEEYTLSWDYSARPNTSKSDSKMVVRVNGVKVATNNENGGSDTQWTSDSYTFIADSDETTVAFVGKGSSNSLGALLDNTSLECVPPEPEPEPEYGPYCGDGIINQDWEQNELGDDGYDGTCQPAEPSQCIADLQLIKITLQETDSVSFDDMVYLGSAGNPIPNGVWFNFNELGDDTINDIATQNNGLAVSRDTEGERLLLGFRGENERQQLDKAIGTIETLGIDFGSVDRNPIVSWPLEDGVNNFYDVFDVDTANNTVNFEMWADTGRDAVAIDISEGDPFNCPLSMDTIDGYKWHDIDGDGVWDEDESGLEGWTIYASDGDSTIETETDERGWYSFTVAEGVQWDITEEDREGWTQTYAGSCAEAQEYGSSNTSFSEVDNSSDSFCFGNQQDTDNSTTEEESSSNVGTRLQRGVAQPQGQVLGAATTASASCGLYLSDYMRIGIDNDPVEVYKLQAFLVGQGSYLLPLTGVFDAQTDRAVREFQIKYSTDILLPWHQAGLSSNTDPTGYVYKTTKWKINDIMCPGIAPFPSLLND